MFGYIIPDAALLTEEQKKDFRAHYCGVCHALRERAGSLSRFLLSYDMAFLSCVLASLYDGEPAVSCGRCPPHPVKSRPYATGRWTEYAADVNILLSYHKAMDDVSDGDEHSARARARLIRPYYLAASRSRPREDETIRSSLRLQKEAESLPVCGLDKASSATAQMLSALYSPIDDVFSEDLGALGAALGRFIYTLDAYDDLERDLRSGCFNPFKALKDRDDLEEYVRDLLMLYMEDAVSAFGALPITHGAGVIRNVLYAGVWTRYSRIADEKRRGTRLRRG